MSDKEPYSRGGWIPGGMPVYLVPDAQWNPDRFDQIPHSEPIIRSCCGALVSALGFYIGTHRRGGKP